jgi:hypothetical protein
VKREGIWWGLLGIGLALVGVWGTWVPHRAAALVLSGWDLAEFVKFLPGVAATRELFYLPVWCAGIALTLISSQRRPKPTRQQTDPPISRQTNVGARRVIPVLIALALMVAILPPYPHTLTGYRTGEFRWRFLLGVSGSLAVIVSGFSSRWPGRVVGALLVLLALAGAAPALWQFLEVREAIEGVYGASLGWGWGLGLFLMGWGLVSVTGARWFIGPANDR